MPQSPNGFSSESLQSIASAALAIERQGVVAWRQKHKPVGEPKERKRRADLKFLDAVADLDVDKMRQAVEEGALDLPAIQKQDGVEFVKWRSAARVGDVERAKQTLRLLDELGLRVGLQEDNQYPIERPLQGSGKAAMDAYRKACVQSWAAWAAYQEPEDQEVVVDAMASLAGGWTLEPGATFGADQLTAGVIEKMREKGYAYLELLVAFCEKSGRGIGAAAWGDLMGWIGRNEDMVIDQDERHDGEFLARLLRIEKDEPPMGPEAAGMLSRIAIELDSVALLGELARKGVLSEFIPITPYDDEFSLELDGLPLMLGALKAQVWDRQENTGRSCFEALAASPQAVATAVEHFDAAALSSCSVEEALELFERFASFSGRGVGGVNLAGVWAGAQFGDRLRVLTKLMGSGFGHMLSEADDQGSSALDRLGQAAKSGELHKEEVDRFMRAFAAWEAKGMKKEIAKPAKRVKKVERARL